MKAVMSIFWLVLGVGISSAGGPSTSNLPRSRPEDQGVSSSAVLAFVESADKDIESLHSFMMVRHGHVVAEGWWSPFDASTPHSLFSLSKSFTSTAVGLAIAEGKLSLGDEVVKFFPGDAPSKPGENLKAMRVSDLLRMSTGHQTEPSLMRAPHWAKEFLAHPVPNKPGTHFLYNTPATYMLSAIVQKVTGETVLDYLKPRLFGPLGIENPIWGTSPQGVSLGGYGLSVRTEDIARFGQLYLQKGQWNGKQLVPASWVEAATSLQTSNGSKPTSDWEQGYGYQFWRARHGAYRGDGAFGQYCLVLPEQDAVIAITSGVKDMQTVLNLVWGRLLPSFNPSSLPPDRAASDRLRSKLASLSLRPQDGAASSGASARIARKTFVFPETERRMQSISLTEEPGDTTTLAIRADGAQQRITLGRGAWIKGRFGLGMMPEQPVAASGAWTADDTFKAKLCFFETPFVVTLTLKFDGEKVLLDTESNVSFGPTRQPQLVGRLQK